MALTNKFLATWAIFMGIDLKPQTSDAFALYIKATEAKLEPRFRGERFLWPEDSPEWREQVRRAEVVVKPAQSNGVIAIKGGLIQDWMGAVFIPRATLKEALAVVQDYGNHRDIYKPEIAEASVRLRTGNDFHVYMRIVKSKLLLTDVLNTEHDIRFTAVDPQRVYSRASSRRIAEVADAGKPGEHELPVGQDRGFLWRIYGYWFFEESDGGVYVTCESITLTRDLPFALSAILGPVIRDLPSEAVRLSLEQTRKAIAVLAK